MPRAWGQGPEIAFTLEIAFRGKNRIHRLVTLCCPNPPASRAAKWLEDCPGGAAGLGDAPTRGPARLLARGPLTGVILNN
jgi:hypothetical protein